MSLNVAFPFRLDSRGRTQTTDDERHVNAMLEILLLTSAGERVNRPDFGGGLRRLLFGPASPELAATVQHTLRAEILQWLDDVIDLGQLEVLADEGRVVVNLTYAMRRDGMQRAANFAFES